MSDARRILLTGASRGLGRAMTAGFVELGHTVLGCCRSEAAAAELQAEFPGPHRFDAVDVADDAAVAVWAESLLADGGPPDLLLNNAGVVNQNEALWRVPLEDFHRVIDVNINGVFHVIRHFVPAMVEQGRGVIVNFSSGWGRSVSAEVAPYCASKWAIEGLTRALAAELPDGMAAIPLNPGVINTEMLQSCFGEYADSYPTPDEWVKRVVPFLLKLNASQNGDPLTAPG